MHQITRENWIANIARVPMCFLVFWSL